MLFRSQTLGRTNCIDTLCRVELGNLLHFAVHDLPSEQLTNKHVLSPPELVFALDLSKLNSPGITFWSILDNKLLLGCGALKELATTHGEIKSMRTSTRHGERGPGRALLRQIIEISKLRNYHLLILETGSLQALGAAQRLYTSLRFPSTDPFTN